MWKRLASRSDLLRMYTIFNSVLIINKKVNLNRTYCSQINYSSIRPSPKFPIHQLWRTFCLGGWIGLRMTCLDRVSQFYFKLTISKVQICSNSSKLFSIFNLNFEREWKSAKFKQTRSTCNRSIFVRAEQLISYCLH